MEREVAHSQGDLLSNSDLNRESLPSGIIIEAHNVVFLDNFISKMLTSNYL